MYIDTHCHVHDTEFYGETREDVYRQARDAGVFMLCVGTDIRSSRQAVEFTAAHEGCSALVGIHPHDAKDNDVADIQSLVELHRAVLCGIGEIGLDYFYLHSPRETQLAALRAQLSIASRYNLPVSFHVRDAPTENAGVSVWEDFWPVLKEFPGVRGVMHSFTDTEENARKAIALGLYIGLNGISTFTKDKKQQELYKNLPLQHILLETDAPFLTPMPFRGKINVSANVSIIAEHQARLKQVPVEDVARITTANARVLFGEKLDARK